MRQFQSPFTDPFVNLALEEQLFLHRQEELFLLWRNEPTIVVGRFQNTSEEINGALARNSGVHVVRRMTGGGAVYHDLGNVNYSYILNRNPGGDPSFEELAAPMLAALNRLGIPAQCGGRNDILLDGRKCSGGARHVGKDRLLYHGTLLFATDLDRMADLLTPDAAKFQSKGIASVRSRVVNISDCVTMELAAFMVGLFSDPPEPLDPALIAAAQRLADEKYRTWDWNYGYSPRYTYQNGVRTRQGGTLRTALKVEEGIIKEAAFTGDFFTEGDLSEVVTRLTGCRHERSEVAETIERWSLHRIFLAVTQEELLECLTGSL